METVSTLNENGCVSSEKSLPGSAPRSPTVRILRLSERRLLANSTHASFVRSKGMTSIEWLDCTTRSPFPSALATMSRTRDAITVTLAVPVSFNVTWLRLFWRRVNFLSKGSSFSNSKAASIAALVGSLSVNCEASLKGSVRAPL